MTPQPNTATLDHDALRLSPEDGAYSRLRHLPLGALQLDAQGRILSRHSRAGHSLDQLGPRIAGRSFFAHYLAGTPLAGLAELYHEGVQNGELYHFIDVTLEEEGHQRDLTLFLYYHSATQQGWVFIEPHADPRRAAGWGLPRAA